MMLPLNVLLYTLQNKVQKRDDVMLGVQVTQVTQRVLRTGVRTVGRPQFVRQANVSVSARLGPKLGSGQTMAQMKIWTYHLTGSFRCWVWSVLPGLVSE